MEKSILFNFKYIIENNVFSLKLKIEKCFLVNFKVILF